MLLYFFFFFFQAEDGIRDLTVTGVQTCALPILCVSSLRLLRFGHVSHRGQVRCNGCYCQPEGGYVAVAHGFMPAVSLASSAFSRSRTRRIAAISLSSRSSFPASIAISSRTCLICSSRSRVNSAAADHASAFDLAQLSGMDAFVKPHPPNDMRHVRCVPSVRGHSSTRSHFASTYSSSLMACPPVVQGVASSE